MAEEKQTTNEGVIAANMAKGSAQKGLLISPGPVDPITRITLD